MKISNKLSINWRIQLTLLVFAPLYTAEYTTVFCPKIC